MSRPYKKLIYMGKMDNYLNFMIEEGLFLNKRHISHTFVSPWDSLSQDTADTVFIYDEWLQLQEDARNFLLSEEFKKQNNTYLNHSFFKTGKKILFPRTKGGDEDEKVNRFGIMEI